VSDEAFAIALRKARAELRASVARGASRLFAEDLAGIVQAKTGASDKDRDRLARSLSRVPVARLRLLMKAILL